MVEKLCNAGEMHISSIISTKPVTKSIKICDLTSKPTPSHHSHPPPNLRHLWLFSSFPLIYRQTFINRRFLLFSHELKIGDFSWIFMAFPFADSINSFFIRSSLAVSSIPRPINERKKSYKIKIIDYTKNRETDEKKSYENPSLVFLK